MRDEIPIHLFAEYKCVLLLFNELKDEFLQFIRCTLQITIFWFINKHIRYETNLLIDHIFLSFKDFLCDPHNTFMYTYTFMYK